MLKEVMVFLAAIIFLVAAFVSAERAFSPTFQQCINTHADTNSNRAAEKNPSGFGSAVSAYISCSAEFFDDHEGGIAAFATLIIAAFTGTLWIASSRQARLTKEAFIADKRAFVFAAGLRTMYELDPATKHYNWRLSPIWQNSGDTPTRQLQFYCDCFLSNTMMPANFDFDILDPAVPPGPGMLGPKMSSPAGVAPHLARPALTPQDILDVQAGRKFLYLWGWTRYFDTLPRTPRRITRFCWMIFVTGNPQTFDPNVDPHSVQFINVYQTRGKLCRRGMPPSRTGLAHARPGKPN